MTSKKILFSLFVVFSIVFVSCKKEKTALENSTNTELSVVNGDSIQPIKIENTTESVALNPEHGQPNHRCDIAVGAPLNSVPSPSSLLNSAPQTPATPATTIVPSTTNTNPIGIKPKLNPAHGQPHHRCDLQVGDPLPDA